MYKSLQKMGCLQTFPNHTGNTETLTALIPHICTNPDLHRKNKVF